MFRKSRIKIVVSIMSVLVLLWVGTLGVIYTSSYFEMRKQNLQMLQDHARKYTLPPPLSEITPTGKPKPDDNRGSKHEDPESPKYRLSTFYSVSVSYTGEILTVKNSLPTVHTNDDLEQLAQRIIQDGVTAGTENNLMFYMADKGSYLLVVFMDNTVVNENVMTLLRYTLIFGGVALVLFFFLSVFLARKIVDPLEESYQKQKQFISDAGHELKTPVSVVSANAELLSRQIGDNQWLANIQYENERMGMLVAQLLELARTENVSPQSEHMDFSRLTAGEALPFESVAFEQGLTLRCDITPGISVVGSSPQLKQLVSILLDNAIRHSKSDGEVSLTLTRDHSTAVLSVVNRGDEIPAQQRAQLFERFYRVDAARNGADRHYGLGLAIAKAIVTSHHGHIGVLCHDGLVEFRVSLPVAR